MPFPWKKKKVNQISQTYVDLHKPTSFIDHFVKNRTRFIKPKSKKSIHPNSCSPPSPPPPSPRPYSPTPLIPAVVCAEAERIIRMVSVKVFDHKEESESSGSEDNWVAESGHEPGLESGSRTMFSAFFKMLLVVLILFTCVKRFTVGITMSAFALLLLEYVGKRVILYLRLCYRVWYQKLGSSDGPIDEGDENLVVSESTVETEGRTESSSSEEIEVVETKGKGEVCCLESYFTGPELECYYNEEEKSSDCSVQEEEEEEDSNGKAVESSCEIPKSGNDKGAVKFKSKMVKKLVPKKLRKYRKKRGKKDKEGGTESSSEGASFEMEEEERGCVVRKDEQEGGNRVH